DPRSSDVNLHDPYLHLLVHVDDLLRILDEAIRELTDVHQSVLMHAYINEGAERRDVRHDARQRHPWLNIRDGLDAFGELKHLEAGAWVSSGLAQLRHDVVQGGQPNALGDVPL